MAGEDPKGEAPSTAESIQAAVGDQFNNLSGFLDGGINIASDALRSSTATAKSEVEKMTGFAKVCLNNIIEIIDLVTFFALYQLSVAYTPFPSFAELVS